MIGENNPNWAGKTHDRHGYVLAPYGQRDCGDTMHVYIACQILKVKKIPKGFHVHHRDTNYVNNDPENLAVLCRSDHTWIHHEFGNAVLEAFVRKEVSLETLLTWTKDPNRAQRVLTTSLPNQTADSLFTTKKYQF